MRGFGALNCSCEVRPSAQTSETGRERLTWFAEVNSVDTIGDRPGYASTLEEGAWK